MFLSVLLFDHFLIQFYIHHIYFLFFHYGGWPQLCPIHIVVSVVRVTVVLVVVLDEVLEVVVLVEVEVVVVLGPPMFTSEFTT